MTIHEHLSNREKDFSAELSLYGEAFNGPGYHSRVPNGTWVHLTRSNIDLAHQLLSSNEPEWVARAQTMIWYLLSLQDQDPVSPTYGIWSWIVEEPLDQMSPPDWNWADFLGIKLVEIINDFGPNLPVDLVEAMRNSLNHAAHSIFRRNVLAGYTNIAVKGGCITAAAGEILGDDTLLQYGTRRLQSIVEHVQLNGGFSEYNSPTYLGIVLNVCEVGLRVLRDAQARAHCEHIWQMAWESLAHHFHPATRQLCGPQSRSYSDFLPAGFTAYLGRRTGLWEGEAGIETDGPLCPAPIIERFRALPSDPLESKHQYVKRDNAHSTTGTTWFTENACLGSVNHGITWHQSRPLLGYWGDVENPAALRIRVLHDGKDFSSGFVWNAQNGPHVLTSWSFITDGGDFHPNLDKPQDGIFTAQDLRLRYELRGKGASVRQLSENQFELSQGDWRAVIHTPVSLFAGVEVQWEITIEDDVVAVDGVCPLPDEHLDFSVLSPISIISGMEILTPQQTATASRIETATTSDGILNSRWVPAGKALRLSTPSSPVKQSETAVYG